MFPTELPGPVRLLVPLDGSELAEAVLPVVESLARRLHPTVTLLHVIEQRPPSTIHGERHLAQPGEAADYLEQVAGRLREAGATVELHVHEAPIDRLARSIVQHAEELDARLVVLCTHGRGGLRDLLAGSIAQQVIQQQTHPTLLVRADSIGEAFEPTRILVPIDGVPEHEPALPAASLLAAAYEASLFLAFVVPTLTTLASEQKVPGLMMPTAMRAVLDMAEQGSDEYLGRLAAEGRAAGLTIETSVVRGDAVPELLKVADQVAADLVVMATHGRTGVDAFLSGSVGARLIDRFHRPLLLVPAG